jgi:hypothetical protein
MVANAAAAAKMARRRGRWAVKALKILVMTPLFPWEFPEMASGLT